MLLTGYAPGKEGVEVVGEIGRTMKAKAGEKEGGVFWGKSSFALHCFKLCLLIHLLGRWTFGSSSALGTELSRAGQTPTECLPSTAPSSAGPSHGR